jgi:hypothetical protein
MFHELDEMLLSHAGGVMDVSVHLTHIGEVTTAIQLDDLCLPRGVEKRVELVERLQEMKMLLRIGASWTRENAFSHL